MAKEEKAPKAEAAKGATPKSEGASLKSEAKVYEVVNVFRSILNYDKEYKPGDTFAETADEKRIKDLIDRKFIK